MSKSFTQILLRLKESLGISSDREVAALLGMEEKAFNARKRRDSFPDDKLYALKSRRTDLRLDVVYVLTGVRGSLSPVQQAHVGAMVRAQGQVGDEKLAGLATEAIESMVASASRRAEKVAVINRLLPLVDEDAIDLLHHMAIRLMASTAAVAASPSAAQQESAVATTFEHRGTKVTVHGDVGQSIEGGQVVHGPLSFNVGGAARRMRKPKGGSES
jgi:hypothetical protein